MGREAGFKTHNFILKNLQLSIVCFGKCSKSPVLLIKISDVPDVTEDLDAVGELGVKQTVTKEFEPVTGHKL